MTHLFEKELDALKKLILTEGSMVEEAISRALYAFLRRDVNLAERVIQEDRSIDQMEIEVEEECLKILALYQPVAMDLRFIVAVLKINNDLERMGDIAANIAKRASFLAKNEKIELDFDFPDMAAKAESMVKRSIDALVERNTELARQVCSDDEALNLMRRSLNELIPRYMKEEPDHADLLIKHLAIARHLERLGDLATNVSEDVIYMVKGEIARHRFQIF